MEPILPLALILPPPGSRELLHALHRQMRAAILDGRLRPGPRLPASRALAAGLGVSRNTAIAVYDLLLSEGYLTARPGAGTYVADGLPRRATASPSPGLPAPDPRLNAAWREPPPIRARPPAAPLRFDFRIGLPDKSAFPFPVWRRLSARALRGLSKAPAAYAAPEGRLALREAIARHVAFTRAVACQPGDILVTSGAQQAFDLLARILVTAGRSVVAIEDPGYPPLRDAFARAGATLVGVPVDGDGLIPDRLPDPVHIICVTPSHQFPLGTALSPQRRARLLDTAQARGAVIIEDDYDGEFRYGGRPLDALQTLDRSGLVFYVGTFSKSLFPALRLGFVVAPPWARPALVAARQLSDWHAPVLAEDTLAAFIAEGHLARHVRRMRKIYGERRLALLQALARHCGDRLTPIASEAGLHLAATLVPAIDADKVVLAAAEAGIGLQTLQRYALCNQQAPKKLAATCQFSNLNGLVFGYGIITENKINSGIFLLSRILR